MPQNPSITAPEYLKGFSHPQLDIILSEEKNKQVVAAAGSGKTRTVIGLLEYRLRENLEQPGRVLLLSFSRKAVGELRERLPENFRNAVEISTFHAFCLHHLRGLYPRALKKLEILTDEKKENFFYEFISHPDNLEQIGGIPIPLLWEENKSFANLLPELYIKAQAAYQEYKLANHLFEFEDLIEIMLKTLRKKKRAFLELSKRYDLVIVDEFQDTDLRQLEFLLLLPVARRVVVGDDWQAIYAFRGASLKPFLDFQKLFSAKVLSLCDNYRSLKNVVHLGSRIIQASSKQIQKKVHAVRGPGPGLPVLGIELEKNRTFSFAEMIQKKADTDYRVLVRTNWRREFWLKMGFPEENVMTIHKSKGLEFPLVFLDLCAGWSGGKTKAKTSAVLPWLLPWMDKPDVLQRDEEIRILYVGASRAMNLLVVLHFSRETASERERFYYEKLVAAKAKTSSLEELPMWIAKEKAFRNAA